MKRFPLFALLLLALALRYYMAFGVETDHYTFDGQQYRAIADAIVDDHPISGFPNGYPIVVALFRAVFGLDAESPLLVLNVLMSTAAVYLTYAIGFRMTGSRWFGLIVAGIMAVFPHQLRYVQLLMTETMTTFLLALAAWFLLEARAQVRTRAPNELPPDNAPAWGLSVGAGLAWQAASGVRPSVGLVGLLVLGLMFLFRERRGLILCVAVGTVLGFLFFTVLDAAHVTRPPQTLNNNALIAIHSESHKVLFVEYPPDEQKRAMLTYVMFAVKKPVTFLRQRLVSLWELWGFWSLPGYRPENGTLAVRFVVLCRFLLFVLSLMAFWRGRRDFAVCILFIPILVVTLIHVATFSNHRFVAPLEPMLFVLAGMAVRDLIGRFRFHRSDDEESALAPLPIQ